MGREGGRAHPARMPVRAPHPPPRKHLTAPPQDSRGCSGPPPRPPRSPVPSQVAARGRHQETVALELQIQAGQNASGRRRPQDIAEPLRTTSHPRAAPTSARHTPAPPVPRPWLGCPLWERGLPLLLGKAQGQRGHHAPSFLWVGREPEPLVGSTARSRYEIREHRWGLAHG